MIDHGAVLDDQVDVCDVLDAFQRVGTKEHHVGSAARFDDRSVPESQKIGGVSSGGTESVELAHAGVNHTAELVMERVRGHRPDHAVSPCDDAYTGFVCTGEVLARGVYVQPTGGPGKQSGDAESRHQSRTG